VNGELDGAGVAAANGEAWVGAKLAWVNGEPELGGGGEAAVAACPNGEATPAAAMEGMAAANGLIGKADDGVAVGDLDGSAAAKDEAWDATGNAGAEGRVPAINAYSFATGRATVRGS